MPSSAKDIDKARDRMMSDFQSLASHADDLLKATTSASGENIDKARKQLQKSLQTMRGNLEQIESAAVDQGKAVVEATETFVRDRPWSALAAAAVVGALIGCIANSGKRG